jgi:hypothetical protein
MKIPYWFIKRFGIIGFIIIVMLSLLFERESIVNISGQTYILWILLSIAVFYISTRGVFQRILWWISISPIYQRGPQIFSFNFGIGDIFTVLIVLEFLVLTVTNDYKIKSNKLLGLQEMVPYCLFGLSIIISFFVSPFGSPTIGSSMRTLAIILICLITFFIMQKYSDIKRIAMAIGLQCIVHVLILCADYYFLESSSTILGWLGLSSDSTRFDASNITAFTLMLSLPFVYLFSNANNKWFIGFSLAVCISLLLVTLSRMGYVALFMNGIILSVMLYKKREASYKYLSGATILAVIVLFLVGFYAYRAYIAPFRETSNIERFTAAKYAYEGFLQYPVAGIGFGQWIKLHELGIGDTDNEIIINNKDYEMVVTRNPHNSILRIAVDMGAIGLLALALIMVNVVRGAGAIYKTYKNTCNVEYICYLMVAANFFISMLLGDYVDQVQLWAVSVVIISFNMCKQSLKV